MLGYATRMRTLLPSFLFGCFVGLLLERTLSTYTENGSLQALRKVFTKFSFHLKQRFDLNLGHIYPRITCLVIVKSSHFRNVKASKETWLQKCDHYLILRPKRKKNKSQNFTSPNNTCERPDDVIDVESESAWGSFCYALRLLPQTVDWLIVVPDSSLVIVENLKKFIKDRGGVGAKYLGYPVQHYSGNYNILSAGIVINNETLARVLHKFPTNESCLSGSYWNNEDVYFGKFLQELGIYPEDTRDEKGRGRFNGFNIHTLLYPPKLLKQTDYYKKALYPVKEGMDCCSPDLITFDGTDADHMQVQHYLLYNVGKVNGRSVLPTALPATKEPPWMEALRSIGYTGPWENITADEYYNIWANYMPPEKFNENMRKVADN